MCKYIKAENLNFALEGLYVALGKDKETILILNLATIILLGNIRQTNRCG